MLSFIFASLLCLAPAFSLAKGPCCVPDQWEAFVSMEQATVSGGKPKVVDVLEPKVSVDFKANKIAAREMVTDGQTKKNITAIIDYNAGAMWTIQWGPGPAVCTKQKLPSGAKPQKCIPPNFKYTGTLRMGFGANAVTVDAYTFSVSSLLTTLLVTSDSCVPVTEYVRTGQPMPSIASAGIFNVTGGIKDRSVFDLPSICKKSEVKGRLENAIGESTMPQLSETSQYWMSRFTSTD